MSCVLKDLSGRPGSVEKHPHRLVPAILLHWWMQDKTAPSVIRRIYEDLNAWNEMEDSSEALSTIRAAGRIYTVPTNIQWHLATSFHNQLESTNIRVSGFKALIGCLCALLKESQQTKDWPPSANLVDISTKSHNSTAAHTHMVWDIHCRLCGVLNGFEPLCKSEAWGTANLMDVTLIDFDKLRTGKSWQIWRRQTPLSVEPGWAIWKSSSCGQEDPLPKEAGADKI